MSNDQKNALYVIVIVAVIVGTLASFLQSRHDRKEMREMQSAAKEYQQKMEKKVDEAITISNLLELDALCWEDADGNITENEETTCEYAESNFSYAKRWCYHPVTCKMKYQK